MARTRVELVHKALAVMGIIKTGQTPSAEDAEGVDAYVDDLIDYMAADEIAYVSDPDSIPNEWFVPIAILLADAASDEFGTIINQDRVELMKRTLRRLNRGRPAYGPQVTEFF